MKKRCKVCFKGYLNANGECSECGATDTTTGKKEAYNPFYGRCELCGKDGRKIEDGEGRSKVIFYRCYDCRCKEFNKERIERANTSNCPFPVIKHGSKEYQSYLAALDEYFHKPRFYNRQPNWIMINNASWRLQKSEVSIEQSKILEAYEQRKITEFIFKDQ